MQGKTKGLITAACSAAFAAVVYSQVTDGEGRLFCANPEQAMFNHDLPMSHPVNRCAADAKSGVSWSSWFSGRTGAGQFHYLDLLELLSRSNEQSEKNPTQS